MDEGRTVPAPQGEVREVAGTNDGIPHAVGDDQPADDEEDVHPRRPVRPVVTGQVARHMRGPLVHPVVGDHHKGRHRTETLDATQFVPAGKGHAQAGTTRTEEDGPLMPRISGTEASTVRPVSISNASGRR